MRNKFAHLVLIRIAQALVRYVNIIETYLAEENMLEKEPENLVDVPPAHWLEKVRQGAPHLLDQIPIENETDSFPNETDELEFQLSSKKQCKQNKKLKKNFFLQQFVYKKSKKVVESITKHIIQASKASVKPSTKTEKDSPILSPKPYQDTAQLISYNSSKNSNVTPIETNLTVTTLQKTHPLFLKSYKFEAAKKKSISQNVTDSINNIEKKTEQTERIQHQSAKLPERTLFDNKATIHLYPKSITQHKGIKFNQNKPINIAKDECNTADLSSKDKEQTFKINQNQKTISTNKKTVLSDSLNTPKKIYKPKDTRVIKPETNTPQASTIDWSSLKNETISEINQDRWPQLPKQEWNNTKDRLNQPYNFWLIQEQTKSKLQSDQEQRGSLWNV